MIIARANVGFGLGLVLLSIALSASAGRASDGSRVYPVSVREAVLIATQAMQSAGYTPVQSDASIGFVQGTRSKRGSVASTLVFGRAGQMVERCYLIDVDVVPKEEGVVLDLWARKAKNMDRADHRIRDENRFRQAFEERLRSYQRVAPRPQPTRPQARPSPQPMRGAATLQIGTVSCEPAPVAPGREVELRVQILANDPEMDEPYLPVLYQYAIFKDGREQYRSEQTVLKVLNGRPTAQTEGFIAPAERDTYRFDIILSYGDHSVTAKHYVEVQ